MKGKISLNDFIQEVKTDLKSAINEEDPFFIMEKVELEICFALDLEAGAKGKFVVLDVGTKTKAQQYHKVNISLTPFVYDKEDIEEIESALLELEDPSPKTKKKLPTAKKHKKATAVKRRTPKAAKMKSKKKLKRPLAKAKAKR